jgi:hypothetical protein
MPKRPGFIAKFSDYHDYRAAMPMSPSDWDCFQALSRAADARRVYLNQRPQKPKTFAPPPPAENGDKFGEMRSRIAKLDEKISKLRGRT